MNKGIIVVNEALPVGLKANISAVLSLSLGKKHPEIVGHSVQTADKLELEGITQIPLPILQAKSETIKQIYISHKNSDLFIVIFDESAMKTKTYKDYEEKVANVNSLDISVHGFLAYGPRTSINKISGDLPLLR